jgi:hypothetical protein
MINDVNLFKYQAQAVTVWITCSKEEAKLNADFKLKLDLNGVALY